MNSQGLWKTLFLNGISSGNQLVVARVSLRVISDRRLRLMQSPRAAMRARSLDLLEDIRATLGFDLVRRFPHQRVAVKTCNLRVDRVFHVPYGGFDAHRIVRIEAGRDDLFLQCLEPFARFRENPGQLIG